VRRAEDLGAAAAAGALSAGAGGAALDLARADRAEGGLRAAGGHGEDAARERRAAETDRGAAQARREGRPVGARRLPGAGAGAAAGGAARRGAARRGAARARLPPSASAPESASVPAAIAAEQELRRCEIGQSGRLGGRRARSARVPKSAAPTAAFRSSKLRASAARASEAKRRPGVGLPPSTGAHAAAARPLPAATRCTPQSVAGAIPRAGAAVEAPAGGAEALGRRCGAEASDGCAISDRIASAFTGRGARARGRDGKL
jgi:hypothetical protein